MKDHEIIELYWVRNESAIAATAEKYGSYCHTIAYNILRNKEDSEECTNDTYLGAWNSIPPQRPNRLSIYLGKITRNLALNRYKRYTAEKRGHTRQHRPERKVGHQSLSRDVIIFKQLEKMIYHLASPSMLLNTSATTSRSSKCLCSVPII